MICISETLCTRYCNVVQLIYTVLVCLIRTVVTVLDVMTVPQSSEVADEFRASVSTRIVLISLSGASNFTQSCRLGLSPQSGSKAVTWQVWMSSQLCISLIWYLSGKQTFPNRVSKGCVLRLPLHSLSANSIT